MPCFSDSNTKTRKLKDILSPKNAQKIPLSPKPKFWYFIKMLMVEG
ncbi:hypothetical protein LLB_0642 [Legionella longbeachae D-4968]|nr:hypothetical protein LLB_0642 [Legionella longbeachae D-4968]